MVMDDPTGGDRRRPFPVPTPLDADAPAPEAAARPSPADLLPPVEGPARRVRRSERATAASSTGPTPGRAPSTRPRRRHRTWPQRLVLALLVVGVVGAAGGAALAAFGLEKYGRIDRVPVALSDTPAGSPRNYLVVGSDTRDTLDGSGLDEAGFTGEGAEGSGQRSDTILVVRVDPAAESIDVLSLPRDLWLPIAGTDGSQRINTAYAGGPQRLVDTIEENFDIPIHHYVEVDFAGFAGLVEAIGGVPMWFETAMRDTHSGLYIDGEGCHVLDPEMALAFARARHDEYRTDDGWEVDGTADLGRITRQQVFLRRSIDQVSQLGVTDAMTLNRLADVAIDSVTFDEALGLDDMLDLGRRFGSFDGDALRTYSLPVSNFRTSGGAAVLRLDEAEAQPVLNLFRGVPVDTIYPSSVDDVTVLNGTGEDGQAGLVADAIEELGFDVEGVGDVDEAPLARTRIRYAPGAEREADLLRRHLTAGADLVADVDLDAGAVVLETGLDLTTIGRRPFPAEDPIPTTTTTADPAAGSEADAQDGTSTTSTTATTEAAVTTSTAPIGVAPDPSASCG